MNFLFQNARKSFLKTLLKQEFLTQFFFFHRIFPLPQMADNQTSENHGNSDNSHAWSSSEVNTLKSLQYILKRWKNREMAMLSVWQNKT